MNDSVLRNHILPRIGDLRLDEVEPMHLVQIDTAMQAKAPRTRQVAHDIVCMALAWAVRMNKLAHHPVRGRVDRARSVHKEARALNAEETGAFLLAARGTRLEAMWVLAVHTGLRSGELFGLQWDDIDLKTQTLAVRRQLVWRGAEWELKPPKTKASRRRVALSDETVSVLREHKLRSVRRAKLVFTDRDGGPLRHPNVRRRDLAALLKRAGLRGVSFRTLRHTMATRMFQGGEHPKVAQERMGHSSVSMTIDIYSDRVPGMQEGAAERLGEQCKEQCKELEQAAAQREQG